MPQAVFYFFFSAPASSLEWSSSLIFRGGGENISFLSSLHSIALHRIGVWVSFRCRACAGRVQRVCWECAEGVQSMCRGCSEQVQSVFRACAEGMQSVYRGCADCVQSVCRTGAESVQRVCRTCAQADLPPESFPDLLSRPWGQAGCLRMQKPSRKLHF